MHDSGIDNASSLVYNMCSKKRMKMECRIIYQNNKDAEPCLLPEQLSGGLVLWQCSPEIFGGGLEKGAKGSCLQ